MIVGILTHDSIYKEIFQKDSEVELAIIMDQLKDEYDKKSVNVDLNVLVIDGNSLSYQELDEAREIYKDIPIFYKLPTTKTQFTTKNIERICAAHRIQPINEYYTIEQVVHATLSSITDKDDYTSNRVIGFFGTHSGVGVSTTVMNLAKALGDRIQEKVLVLTLNSWDPADYFLNYKGKYLNDLKVDLKTKSLTSQKLGEAVSQHGNFFHLAGNRDIKMQRFYTNDEISHLIEVAKETFDLILIDGGTHFDTATATQAYVSSTLRFIVTSQEDKGYRGYFPHVFQQLIEPSGGKKSDFMLILNKYQPNMSLINEKDLEDELEINRVATLPDMDILGAVSIRQKKLLYEVGEGNYKKNMDIISNLIIAESKLSERPLLNNYSKNKGLARFFQKNKVSGGDHTW